MSTIWAYIRGAYNRGGGGGGAITGILRYHPGQLQYISYIPVRSFLLYFVVELLYHVV